ncbi:LysM peptidoglycan-binding domain-containing protein [Alicyclobacillaceae bacterium I2511]|nr:LysM peptidoglycan-binding domain-containing protein [Alicyclobacillaceae bacterium I2511]
MNTCGVATARFLCNFHGGCKTGGSGVYIHTVLQGESLWGIARTYGGTAQDIARGNRLPTANLVPGQTLLVPGGGNSYVVMPGDTVVTIADNLDIPVQTLLMWNRRLATSPILPFPGDILRIPKSSKMDITVLGFLELLNSYLDQVHVAHFSPDSSYLALFGYGLSLSGNVLPAADAAALAALRLQDALPTAVFANWTGEGFSPAAVHTVLCQASVRERYVRELLQVVDSHGYQAVVMDFESIRPEDGESFVQLVRDIRSQLPQGIPVWVAVMPVTGQEPPTDRVAEAYDYVALGRYADALILMAYNWSWATGSPGPIAPFAKVEATIQYALRSLSPTQLLLGVIRYGYDWALPFHTGDMAATVSAQDATGIAMTAQVPIQFDSASLMPSFIYPLGDTQHYVSFEDARSMQLKFQLVRKYGLAGVAPWQLGQRFPQFRPLLQQNFRIHKAK